MKREKMYGSRTTTKSDGQVMSRSSYFPQFKLFKKEKGILNISPEL